MSKKEVLSFIENKTINNYKNISESTEFIKSLELFLNGNKYISEEAKKAIIKIFNGDLESLEEDDFELVEMFLKDTGNIYIFLKNFGGNNIDVIGFIKFLKKKIAEIKINLQIFDIKNRTNEVINGVVTEGKDFNLIELGEYFYLVDKENGKILPIYIKKYSDEEIDTFKLFEPEESDDSPKLTHGGEYLKLGNGEYLIIFSRIGKDYPKLLLLKSGKLILENDLRNNYLNIKTKGDKTYIEYIKGPGINFGFYCIGDEEYIDEGHHNFNLVLKLFEKDVVFNISPESLVLYGE